MRPRTTINVEGPAAVQRLMHTHHGPVMEVELRSGDTTVRLMFDDVEEMRRVVKEMSAAASELSAEIASRSVPA